MRIIEGKFAGREIWHRVHAGTRVTSERVRKSVFDILKNIVCFEGAHVLDAFAGSGTYGIESLSRGAASCLFLDTSKDTLRDIEKNITKFGITNLAWYASVDWEHFIKQEKGIFDIIFVDPPYHTFDFSQLICVKTIMSTNSILVLESGKHTKLPNFSGFDIISDRRYGDTNIIILRLSA